MALKYKELLQQSEEVKEGQEIQFKVEEALQSLQSDILATKKSLAKIRRDILKAKAEFPLNASKIIQLQTEAEGFEDGLKRLEELQAELF